MLPQRNAEHQNDIGVPREPEPIKSAPIRVDASLQVAVCDPRCVSRARESDFARPLATDWGGQCNKGVEIERRRAEVHNY